jgi:hypothetical protein
MSALELELEKRSEIGHGRGETAVESTASNVSGVVRGSLIGFKEHGLSALVVYPGQPGNVALTAASCVELHGMHIGRQVALMFENGDPLCPVIVGLLRNSLARAIPEAPGQVEVAADGQRLTVSAKRQLVLRCGEASITLDADGKVSIRGVHVVSHAAGVNRIRGGSIQLN